MTYDVFYLGMFLKSFKTRDAALNFIINDNLSTEFGDYEVLDDSDRL